ncbi:citrate lyase holo-[acyl-carrier protein] synthase [Levilactobacillus yonginensis]|uniref:citrate lyase holo-[acyl-carrier protein] synthase n=1 Tax=Levilactobacillus yonginensis TaxID=1054041 RepID=UPI000F78F763|nr:citrate lyase holo-[acyl-carrier protein] synthase [Levilactobacillus yonginensis]
MSTLFDKGQDLTIADVLANKDRRVAFQQEALAKYPAETLVAVKLNIPGPIKNNQGIQDLFVVGIDRLAAAFKQAGITTTELNQWHTAAGNELFWMTPMTAQAVKQVAVAFEDEDDLGRIFDVDVLMAGSGASLSRTELGSTVRRCFICNRPAKECARSRRHSVAELQAHIDQVYQATIRK